MTTWSGVPKTFFMFMTILCSDLVLFGNAYHLNLLNNLFLSSAKKQTNSFVISNAFNFFFFLMNRLSSPNPITWLLTSLNVFKNFFHWFHFISNTNHLQLHCSVCAILLNSPLLVSLLLCYCCCVNWNLLKSPSFGFAGNHKKKKKNGSERSISSCCCALLCCCISGVG